MFGFLLSRFSEINGEDTYQILHQYLRFIICFFSILLVWNEYRIGATIYVWIPNIKDTLIPFLLAFSQAFLIYTIVKKRIIIGNEIEILNTSTQFLIAFSSYWLVAILAYLNMYRNVERYKIENGFSYQYSRIDRIKNSKIILLISGMTILTLSGTLFSKNDKYVLACEIIALLIVLIMIGMREVSNKKLLEAISDETITEFGNDKDLSNNTFHKLFEYKNTKSKVSSKKENQKKEKK